MNIKIINEIFMLCPKTFAKLQLKEDKNRTFLYVIHLKANVFIISLKGFGCLSKI